MSKLKFLLAFFFLIQLGFALGFAANYSIQLGTNTQSFNSNTDLVVNFSTQEVLIEVASPDLTQIHVLDLNNKRMVQKNKVNYSDLHPLVVAGNDFSLDFTVASSSTCNWFSLGQDDEGVSEVNIDSGLQSFNVDKLTNVFLGVDADVFETCKISVKGGDKVLVVEVDFKKPFDEEAYIASVSQVCSADSSHRCLTVDGVEIDLDHCTGTGEGQLGYPLAVCIGGKQAIESHAYQVTQEENQSLKNRVAELETQSEPEIFGSIQEINNRIDDIFSRVDQSDSRQSEEGNSHLIGILLAIGLIAGVAVYRNQSDLETRATPVFKDLKKKASDFVGDVTDGLKKNKNQDLLEEFDVSPEEIVEEQEKESFLFKPNGDYDGVDLDVLFDESRED